LSDAAERVEAGDFSTRVREPERGAWPVRQLSRRFNTMAARLEADETQRRTLLADVGHELRTPLAVIQGNLEAILDGVHPADDAHLAAILDETRVLSRLVDDLRTVTLSETGSLALHRESTDLGILAAEVAASFGPAATDAGVSVEIDIADDLPLLDVDPVRIREVLANLVANALRHTPRDGSIRIEAEASGAALVVRVRDTGAGIDAALLPDVFDRFAKGADSRGSGLGLAIARGLVEAHGGTIEVASEPGHGAVFTFRLPVTEPDAR
jgi:two-component system sensor histidine kinase BaeS